MESGQSQFAALKLRSLALVPSSGAQSAPSNSTYGSSTARLFPPRQALRSETRGRFAPRFAHIRKKGHGQQSVVPLATLAPQPPARRAGQSPTVPRGHKRPGANCQCDRQCPESAYINIIPSGLCNSSRDRHLSARTTSICECQRPARTSCLLRVSTIRIMLSTLRKCVARVVPPSSRARRRQERAWLQWSGCTRPFASPTPGRGIGAPFPNSSTSALPRTAVVLLERHHPLSVSVSCEYPAALRSSAAGSLPLRKSAVPQASQFTSSAPAPAPRYGFAVVIPGRYSPTPLPGQTPPEVFRASGRQPFRLLALRVSVRYLVNWGQ